MSRHDTADTTSASKGSRDDVPEAPTQIGKPGWISILKRSVQQFTHDDVTDRAAALTYFGVLAIFPGVLVLISIMGLIGKANTQTILNNIGQLTPGGVSSFLHTVIQQVQGRAGAASIGAIIGLLIALWSASGYVAAFMRASNSIYEVDEGRPAWKTIPVRLAVTILVVVMLVISAVIVVVTGPVASTVGNALGIGDAAVMVWDIAKWPVLLVIVSIMFSLLYWACPNVKQPGFKWVTPGGVVAVLVWVIASALFALYVSFSGSYNKTYGSLATVIVFLVWLWISNIAILLGVEFNAETERQRAIQAGMPAETEPFVDVRDSRKLQDPEKRQVEEAARIRQETMR